MTTTQSIPVTVIGGYLGAGKTTLVNHLLRNAAGRRLAVLVNEFGELPIDADLIQAQDRDIISLSGGCVCCSYGNDLLSAMMDVGKLQPRPDHILLESSGVAIPGAIASSLSLLSDFVLDGIVVMADAETVRQRAADKYMSDTVLRQLADADIVLLNKTDLVARSSLHKTLDWLQLQAPSCTIVETQQAQAPLAVVLQSFDHVDAMHAVVELHGQLPFETYQLPLADAVEPVAFAEQLIASSPNIVRAKGFVHDLHGGMKTVQIVGKRFDISDAPEGVACGVVVIRASS